MSNDNTHRVNPMIDASWLSVLQDEFNADYFYKLKKFLLEEKEKYTIFPPGKLMFHAFNLTPFEQVKVVILGQDPYHNVGQAHGLCFSVPDGVPHPKSLINIFKELHDDLQINIPKSGNLEKWAKQGVLLINAILSVRAHQAGSHQNQGWEIFTDSVIRHLSEQREGIVFILWGNYAKKKESLIDKNRHFVLTAPHPSPLSAFQGFFGCNHFSKTNQLLIKAGKTPIDWTLEA